MWQAAQMLALALLEILCLRRSLNGTGKAERVPSRTGRIVRRLPPSSSTLLLRLQAEESRRSRGPSGSGKDTHSDCGEGIRADIPAFALVQLRDQNQSTVRHPVWVICSGRCGKMPVTPLGSVEGVQVRRKYSDQRSARRTPRVPPYSQLFED